MKKLLKRPLQTLSNAAQLFTFHKRHPPVGSMPGTLVTEPDARPPVIRLVGYTIDGVRETDVTDPEQLCEFLGAEGVTWVDVQGLGDEGVLRRIAEIFQIHPLALEDAVNVPQRPKSEPYEAQHLFIVRMTRVAEGARIEAEQVSFFIGRNYVLTLQERYGDVFDPVRKRVRIGKGPIRRMGPDYLAYALIDTVIDAYYPLLEMVGDQLYELEEAILVRPTAQGLRRIHAMRRELLGIRRAVWPQREAVNNLMREESPLISDGVRVYLRDTLDHAAQITDLVESYREITSGLMDIYLSSTGQKTNEVMKVLTIMASIFIPLTFLAGVYGMNFQYLPGLQWHDAWWAICGIMAATTIGMLLYFRHRGWIGSGDGEEEESDR
ncbi:MAG TPA: magnesium/cobalt transporter CorA [Gemmatimonadales bacterium]|nr:magnesium/cobalt transporter CorA [Gemmatimonadales bacterium]